MAEKALGSKTKLYNKNQCIICQKEEGRFHNVEMKPMGEKMLNVAKELNDESLFIRLINIARCTDTVVNDVKYHLKCWVSIQRSVIKLTSDKILELDNLDRVIVDIEIVDLVKSNSSSNDGEITNINNINKT